MLMLIRKSKSVYVNLIKAGEILISKIIDVKNVLIFIFIFSTTCFLTFSGLGENFTMYLFNNRSTILIVFSIAIFSLVIVKCLTIFKRKGMSSVFSSDYRFLGPAGDSVVQAFSILTASYTGFIVISLIVLDKFPEEVPNEGLIFISLLMFFLLGWSGFQISGLIRETLIISHTTSQVKEVKNLLDIMHCSNLTSDEIRESFKPKTKDVDWYNENCIDHKDIPDNSVNGYPGGTPFYTKDNKIMRSGISTWNQLEISKC